MNDATELLSSWQRRRLDTVHANRTDYGHGTNRVTVLAYYWGADAEKPDTSFCRIESAFRETWLNCGMLKSVIVTDNPTSELRAFAQKFPCVEIQVEPSLIPGNLYTMSADCDGKFADRFNTDYLMVIQDDGFPLKPGLDEFLGKWDFIGPPYVRDRFFPRLIAKMFNLGNRIGCHTMRKTFGYWHYKKNKDLEILRQWFNHTSQTVTRRYIGIDEDERKKSVTGFNPGGAIYQPRGPVNMGKPDTNSEVLEIKKLDRSKQGKIWGERAEGHRKKEK